MTRRAPLAWGAAAALVITISATAQAQPPSADPDPPSAPWGVAPPPPRPFEPPVFTVVDARPSQEGGSRAGGKPGAPSRLLVQVDAGARYRRMYSGDISAFQLALALGARVRPFFHPSGFVLGGIGATNQGLQARFLSVGSELAFPLAGQTDTFFRRVTPAIRLRVSYADVERITRSQLIYGIGAGADAQLGVDLFQEGAHAIYAVFRAGIDGYFTEGEGFSPLGGFGTWGGELALGFRY